ncbi:T9SS type B sorting domain-containing protein [Luteirhabdus pelagi]|uniref:T9SS type B sorting domain-containing protein n=1 Tax=Luteirhabdus pelagi TaxID=2792783 RepID=UPI00193A8EB3|nr:gliding motility-associated C-terminal domain-containing protein [Luteirhabdus pelagi]
MLHSWKTFLFTLILILASLLRVQGQEVTLLEQYNGTFDYVAFGNTLNIEENGSLVFCDILTESSAEFTLPPDQSIVAAYLYWAGSGPGDFEVELNDIPYAAERQFSFNFTTDGGTVYTYFAAFADVTDQVSATGSETYTLSELDLTDVIQSYCFSNNGNGTNFGGWTIVAIVEGDNLPNSQLSVFDGLEGVSSQNEEVTIVLDNLEVTQNLGATIGFLAWEGDSSIAVNETLRLNGDILSDPPLNPAINAFNGTNTFTGSDELYNMDIDYYSTGNSIEIGDTEAIIQLTSGRDVIMINNIVTILKQLPDATIEFEVTEGGTECGNRDIELEYTVFNPNSSAALPAATPIAFYANSTLIGQAQTLADIPVDGSETNTISLTVPDEIPAEFTIRAVVDDTGNGAGIVEELNEDNNTFEIEFELFVFPDISELVDLEVCEIFGTEQFDLTKAIVNLDDTFTIEFYLTEADAENQENEIENLEAFENTENPQTIWLRVDNGNCFVITSFNIEVIDCPIPDAAISISEPIYACRGRELSFEYTVYNTEDATAPLASQTPIAFYADNQLLAQAETNSVLLIGESETASITTTLPESLPDLFLLTASVDDDGTGNGVVFEFNETNNLFDSNGEFRYLPPIEPLPQLLLCDEGFDTATFDLTEQDPLVTANSEGVVTYFTSEEDAQTNTNPIDFPNDYQNTSDPQQIFVRLENEICFTTASFEIATENCPIFIPQGFSPNSDGINDVFEITNLLDIYPDFNLKVYTRRGDLIYEGGNSDGFWNAIPNRGIWYQDEIVPTGTYYYVLVINDPEYPEAIVDWVYINY